ncbi:MAG: ABC transporter substrate-binding protein [Anaerolineales bacterium]
MNGANQLLDSAGWAPGPDGIRVKNNVRASLTLLTASDSPISQKASKIIQASLKAIGIEVKFNYQPSSVVVSGDGLYGRNFDMIEYAKVFSKVDPGSWWYDMANCKQIPTGANNFAGNNFAGWCN